MTHFHFFEAVILLGSADRYALPRLSRSELHSRTWQGPPGTGRVGGWRCRGGTQPGGGLPQKRMARGVAGAGSAPAVSVKQATTASQAALDRMAEPLFLGRQIGVKPGRDDARIGASGGG